MTITQNDLTSLYGDDRWEGHGYLNERRKALQSTDPECPAQPDRAAEADARVIREANERGWTVDDLMYWANSRQGRHFGDAWLGGTTLAEAERFTPALMTLGAY